MTISANRHKPFLPSESQKAILEILAEYYCLRIPDIARLLRGREPTPSDLRDARRNMVALLSDRLVTRHGYRQFVDGAAWGLSDKGVIDFGGKSFDEQRLTRLEHELTISRFHISLNHLCDERSWTLEWQQIDLKRTIHPDAFFSITNEKGRYCFFLEIERQPNKLSYSAFQDGKGIIAKLDRYVDYFQTDQCFADWEIRKFRTVIVQTNDRRRQNLLETLRKNEKLNRRMFWLTTEPLYKEDIGGEIFRTPADPETGRHSFFLL